MTEVMASCCREAGRGCWRDSCDLTAMRIQAVGKLSCCCLSLGSQLPKYCERCHEWKILLFSLLLLYFSFKWFPKYAQNTFSYWACYCGTQETKKRPWSSALRSGVINFRMCFMLTKVMHKDGQSVHLNLFLSAGSCRVPENGYTVVRCFFVGPIQWGGRPTVTGNSMLAFTNSVERKQT